MAAAVNGVPIGADRVERPPWSGSMVPMIRIAGPGDFAATSRIEEAADRLLVGSLKQASWPPAATAEQRAGAPGFTLVAEVDGQIIGFAQLLEVDGAAHLEQVSVLPEHGRRGVGRALVEAAVAEARRRGHRAMTLRTFAEVAFNAPFYATCGFAESTPSTPFERGLVETEDRLGLTDIGRRIQMTRRLDD